MNRLIVARHAESEYNMKGLISADPSSPRSPLTSRGRRQACQLTDRLEADDIEVCVTSRMLRAVKTSEIVATELSIPVIKTPLLDDPPVGIFEDGPVEAFVEWMKECGPDVSVPGTSTSLRDSAHCYFDAVTTLLRLEGDTFFGFIKRGAITPWLCEANAQNEVFTQALQPPPSGTPPAAS